MRDRIPPIRSLADRFSRRKLIGKTANTVGAGLVLGASSARVLSAADDESDFGQRFRRRSDDLLPLPIPHIASPPNVHFFPPGPVDTAPNGLDPSTITNFEGFVGEADFKVSGMGTDLSTGAQSPYDFEADIRFMRGRFIGSDERHHHGTLAFI
jgi:hypothetical protein